MFFDPLYLVFMIPALLLAGWAQLKVQSAYKRASNIAAGSGLSGREVAERILGTEGLSGQVAVEMTRGFLGDHYDPSKKVLRLSPEVFNGRSLAALGVAAHEAGHAIQDARHYVPLKLRNAIVPMASFGSNASIFIIIIGALFSSFQLIVAGIFLFSLVVVFQLINLPVEFDASARAKEILTSSGYISQAEYPVVSEVLSAAAMTYVAATLSSILTLLYYIVRFGLGGSRD
ncbi:MAG: zinc metallopeptidase [Candidatus Dadabacteria bacterium]|nr:MAG: zinc metallopeptidase [Candidatus Dadabacteria bacterium]